MTKPSSQDRRSHSPPLTGARNILSTGPERRKKPSWRDEQRREASERSGRASAFRDENKRNERKPYNRPPRHRPPPSEPRPPPKSKPEPPLHAKSAESSGSGAQESTHLDRMIEVIANDRLGGKVRVKCFPDDTVGDLKKLIAAQRGTKANKIVLKKWYTIFKDHIRLSDYEIHDGMSLEMH